MLHVHSTLYVIPEVVCDCVCFLDVTVSRLSVMWYVFTRTDNKYTWPTGRQHIHRSARSLKAEHPRSTGARLPVVLVCTLPAPRQIHDAGRPSHVIPMAIHRSVHEAKGAGCGRLPGAVVALGSSGSSASLRKMRHDFIPPRRCPSTIHPRLVFALACPVTCVGVCICVVFPRVCSRVGGSVCACVRACVGV